MLHTRYPLPVQMAGWAALVLAVLGAGAAHAQARYQCRTSNGSAYFSDQPCPGVRSTAPIIIGPLESQPRYVPPPASVGEAPAHLIYMSPRCASLHDALRTAQARGLSYDTQNTMRRDYTRECSENESEAMATYYKERGEARQQKREAQIAEKREKDRASLHAEQCGESKRILVTKRARTDLTEGEKAELKRFEENYRARCGG